jgi:hypothetical protein
MTLGLMPVPMLARFQVKAFSEVGGGDTASRGSDIKNIAPENWTGQSV